MEEVEHLLLTEKTSAKSCFMSAILSVLRQKKACIIALCLLLSADMVQMDIKRCWEAGGGESSHDIWANAGRRD